MKLKFLNSLTDEHIQIIEEYFSRLENESWMRCHYADLNILHVKLHEVKFNLSKCKQGTISAEEINKTLDDIHSIICQTHSATQQNLLTQSRAA